MGVFHKIYTCPTTGKFIFQDFVVQKSPKLENFVYSEPLVEQFFEAFNLDDNSKEIVVRRDYPSFTNDPCDEIIDGDLQF